MQDWSPEEVARAADAHLDAAPRSRRGPERVVIDSRQAGPGALFVGLKGEKADGGAFAEQALAGGAGGTLTAPTHAPSGAAGGGGAVRSAADPLRAVQLLGAPRPPHRVPHGIGLAGPPRQPPSDA